MLTIVPTAARTVLSLDGVWNFRCDLAHEGRAGAWQAGIPQGEGIAVPASYNDLVQDRRVRDHIGEAWYERAVAVPADWAGRRIVLRFGAVAHDATVFWDGVEVGRHRGGFLPFEIDLTGRATPGRSHRLTVVADNRMDWSSLPPGELRTVTDEYHPDGMRVQDYHFDFFHYAGIPRPVLLYCTPMTHIAALRADADHDGADGILRWRVAVTGGTAPVSVAIEDGGRVVARADGEAGELRLPGAGAWNPLAPRLYDLVVRAGTDEHRLRIGFRRLAWDDRGLLVNGRRVYLSGFGMHEDHAVIGKGWNDANAIKDLNLLRWIGANSVRTAHYPYAEGFYDLCDERGILVIDETAAVGMQIFGGSGDKTVFRPGRVDEATRSAHAAHLRALIERDANHPCVVMWSIANEPASQEPAAADYFRPLFALARELDATRPLTFVAQLPDPRDCQVSQFCDIICVNRYYAWYFDYGKTEVIAHQMAQDLRRWRERFGKAVFITEYGADTIAGFHCDPPQMFSEEYQQEFLDAYHAVFDQFDYVCGEHPWQFADFATKQGVSRIIGNRKGVFSRDRQPKMAAHALRSRWSRRTTGR
jgi:beta-glucuronidase